MIHDPEQEALDCARVKSKQERPIVVIQFVIVSIVIIYGLYSYYEKAESDYGETAKTQISQPHTQSKISKRQAAQDYWASVMVPMSTAYDTLAYPEAFGVKDAIDASSLVKQTANLANEAMLNASGSAKHPVPYGWEDVQEDLQGAAFSLKTGCQKLRKFIDSRAPSDAVDARDDANTSRQLLASALQKARKHYVQMGGRAEQLRDYGVPKP